MCYQRLLHWRTIGSRIRANRTTVDNDNSIFQGRLLHIISARPQKDTKLDDYEISKLPLKKQKEIRRKQDAVKATFNWNSLYLNVHISCRNRMNITDRFLD
jgi:hypothetical protein